MRSRGHAELLGHYDRAAGRAPKSSDETRVHGAATGDYGLVRAAVAHEFANARANRLGGRGQQVLWPQ